MFCITVTSIVINWAASKQHRGGRSFRTFCSENTCVCLLSWKTGSVIYSSSSRRAFIQLSEWYSKQYCEKNHIPVSLSEPMCFRRIRGYYIYFLNHMLPPYTSQLFLWETLTHSMQSTNPHGGMGVLWSRRWEIWIHFWPLIFSTSLLKVW